jgi:hypothetical protein
MPRSRENLDLDPRKTRVSTRQLAIISKKHKKRLSYREREVSIRVNEKEVLIVFEKFKNSIR